MSTSWPRPRSGPAGGLAGGLHAFLGAELLNGAALVLDFIGPTARFDRADLVLTGEGRLGRRDARREAGRWQSPTPRGRRGAPAITVCGGIDIGPEDLLPHGIVASEGLGDESSPEAAPERAAALVEAATKRAVLRWLERPRGGGAGV